MKTCIGLLAGAVAASVSGVQAARAADAFVEQSTTGPSLYLAVAGGWSYADSDKFELEGAPIGGEIFFKDGWTGKIALGGRFNDHVRTELEFAIRHNALDDEDINGLGTIDLDGEADVYTGLVKLAYDFCDGPLRPFIGAGLGIASFDVNIDAPVNGSDSDLAFAGALDAGVNNALSPNAEIYVEAEALLLDDLSLDPASTGSATLESPLFFSAALDLRWSFR